MMKKDQNWPGEERRYPKEDHPCKYTLDRIREEVILFSKNLPENSKIIDFGCGEKPYYPFLEEKSAEYIGIDIEDSPEKNKSVNITIKQGEKIPFPDDYFDALISTQVFEHIEDIWFYAKELERVLKKNGNALISSAFSWDYHPYPKDYWRITEDGYRVLFSNFSEIDFVYDTNSLQTILQSLNLLFARREMRYRFIYRMLNYIIAKMNYRKGDKKFPSNIFVHLKK
jgi:SAM-dependent methyltransferase